MELRGDSSSSLWSCHNC